MDEEQLAIPAQLVTELLNYLSMRPYREVSGAVQALQSLQPIKQTAPPQQ